MEYLFLILICLPKFNIFNFESVSQGIRIDDIIVLILFIKIYYKVRFKIIHVLIFIFISIISIMGLINNYNDFIFLRLMSLLRILEYVVIYYAAQLLLSKEQIGKLIKTVVIFQFLIVVFQYASDHSIRPSGTTAGPWELGLVCGVSAIFLSFSYGFRRSIIYNILIATILILASARAQIMAMLVIAIIAVYNIFRINKALKICVLIILSILMLLSIYYIDYGYINFSRSINFARDFYLDVLDDIMNLRVSIRTNEYDVNYYDPSLVSRVLQWEEYISSTREAKNIPFALFFGSGANSGGLILDGFYIKMLVDFGVLGVLIYIFYLIKLICNYRYVYYGVLIAISSLTLDLFWASKFMYTILIATSLLQEGNND